MDPFLDARRAMVREQLRSRGLRDLRVLEAMEAVPRHRFAPPELLAEAHADWPLPIGLGQTLSQPYIVGFMAEALALKGTDRVLEVGAGSGYAAAVMARIAREVWAMELEPALCRAAEARLNELEVPNVHLCCGDGARGLPEAAPFDAILLSCAAPLVPAALWGQLAPDGRLLLPLGSATGPQDLMLYRKAQGLHQGEPLLPVRFVPLR